jgi:hypothetical protein
MSSFQIAQVTKTRVSLVQTSPVPLKEGDVSQHLRDKLARANASCSSIMGHRVIKINRQHQAKNKLKHCDVGKI